MSPTLGAVIRHLLLVVQAWISGQCALHIERISYLIPMNHKHDPGRGTSLDCMTNVFAIIISS